MSARSQIFRCAAALSALLIGLVFSAVGATTDPAAGVATRTAPTAKQPAETQAERGLRLLLEKPFLSPDFDQQVFDELWKTWEEPLRSQAEKATSDERRAMAFSRYGLTERPGDPKHRPSQYVVDDQGNWTMNCLACHQGKVAGKVYPGAPNSLYALETLTEEVMKTKQRLKKPMARMERGSRMMPLGTTNGTTNAVMFGVALLSLRDADLNLTFGVPPSPTTSHDHDAPAWWNFHRRRSLYSDGFAAKTHRALMQFLLDPENGPEKFSEWEADFKDVYAWLDSLTPPKYPWPIDAELADAGHKVFAENCQRCHGAAGRDAPFPNKIIPIEEVATDPVRLEALTVRQRKAYSASWFGQFGKQPFVADPGGYVPPPLDGIWASAPYFHNGSVPTLWHVLHPEERPKIWKRSEDGYDQKRVGLEIETFDAMPESAYKLPSERRKYFNTAGRGKSAEGHDYADKLSEEQKRAILEYLKTI